MRTTLPNLRILLLAFSAAASSLAQEPAALEPVAAQAPAISASSPRVARLAWFRGDLQIQRADNTAPTPTADNPHPDSAVMNMPITEGARLVTGDDSEAEIEFEDGSVVRLTPKTALSVDSLNADGKTAHTRISLLSGLAYFELRHAQTATYSISAGGILALPAENVVFRMTLDQPPALVSVLSGTLSVHADVDPENPGQTGFSATVKAGESLKGDPDDAARYFLNPQLAENSWDAWNQSRDSEALAGAATRTTARDDYAATLGYGWSDLDANGTWYTVTNPDGSVSELWQPSIAADPDAGDSGSADAGDSADAFDPYGDGAFVYSGGGYYWASSYSWGWLPYRCGRWNYYPQFGWTWSPNRFCRTFGYGGGGGINIGHHPRRYHVIQFPPVTPFHPILRVHTSDPRPKVPHQDNPPPVKLAAGVATPLEPQVAPTVPASGFSGGSFYRDYPIQAETHQSVLGTMAPAATEAPARTGWIVTPAAPGAEAGAAHGVRSATDSAAPRPAAPARAAAPAPAPRAAPAPAAPSKPK